ncbi:hypothetical protein IU501_04680 [Nocardia otitidiscaviarum]|uniref:hypothetical protein n=1 Tax=Nocardia otitidiscaviarum TaxID=1823 RepID=UPI0004A737C5|nr:hypothetical protein [Nocardia otitidiscaviarum]MBF6132288.1 hypothetical protein [Nocardia otitidiscaviarum]MBF6483380.1 hypothetical protein [Nocardia otitidiscaviarum]
MRGATVGTTVAGIGAALAILAPDATAADQGYVTEASNPMNPKAGCSYTVTGGDLVGGGSSAANGLPVSFYDNGVEIGTDKVGGLLRKAAKASWTPKTTGQHMLTATGSWGYGHEITLAR